MRVLLIEDDRLLGDALRAGLGQRGFEIDWQTTGTAGLAAARAGGVHAIVLDLGLPGLDGAAVLTKLRGAGDATPVVVLTARDAVPERVGRLDDGADDYLVKPVDLDELAARIRAVVRRRSGATRSIVSLGDVQVDLGARSVTHRGQPVALQPREYALLEALVLNAGRVVTRSRLDELLYGWEADVDSNAIEVHVHHLRRKLQPDLIRTVRGVGYLIPAAH